METPQLKGYVVKCRDESEAKRAEQLLAGKGIITYRPQVQLACTAFFFPAIAFLEEDRPAALALLGRRDGPVTATKTPNLGLLLTERVTVHLPPGEQGDVVAEVIESYVSDLDGLAVLLSNPHCIPCPAVDEPCVLHVRLYTSPAPTLLGRPVPTVYRRPLPAGVRDGVAPSLLGRPITAPEGVVAEVLGNNLYVLFDLTHATTERVARAEVMAQIMEQFLEQRETSARDAEALFMRAARRRHKVHALSLRERTDFEKRRLDALDNQRRLVMDALKTWEEASAALAASGEVPQEAAEREFALLRRTRHVRSVRVEDGCLKVETDGEIAVQANGQTYLLGPYSVEIPIWGDNLRIKALSPKTVDGAVIHHPHVTNADGIACLMNFAKGAGEFLSTWDWGLVAEQVIAFLHKVNLNEERARNLLRAGWTPSVIPQVCICERAQRKEDAK